MPAFTVGTYDLGSDNRLNLLAAINAQNGTTYTLAEYDFTEPVRVTTPNPIYNTSIKLGPLAATGKIGFKTIYYNRIHVSDIGILTITYQNELFLTELLGRLSEKYGIPLSPSDVFEQRIIPPVFPETEISLTLNFKESSIAYYGGGAIVLGTNDPAIEFESPLTMPFKNELVFYVNNFIKTNTGNNYLESSILAIASDKIRTRTMNVTDHDTTPYAAILKNTYSDANRTRLEQFLPFVFTWTVGETKIIRGVNIYGDVIEINETSNSIVKINNLYIFDPLVTSEVTEARNKIFVREGTQDRNGDIYLLVGDPSTSQVSLLKSVDQGLNFSTVTVTKTNRATFNYAAWENVVIHDMLVANDKLYVLVTNPVTYGVIAGKSPNGPAVEEFNLSSGVTDFFPLFNQGNVINASLLLVFNSSSKLRFVSSENEAADIDVVGFARTASTLETVAVYFHRPTDLEYIPEIIDIKVLDYPIYGISAYSKPLVKDPLGSFVSVEILTMVPSSIKDDFFLIENNERSENSHLGYGIITASCIRKGLQRSEWIEDVLDLGGGSKPMTVTVIDQGKRNHYVFSGSNGIYRTQYSESAPNVFVPVLDKVFDVGSHAGFSLECDIGNGNYVSPAITENEAMAATFFDYPNEESVKPLIDFSFIVRNKLTDEDMWLTSPDTSTELSERVFSKEYGFLGTTPIAVFTDSTGKTFAWTKYQGIYVSSNQGGSWYDYSAVKSYYSNSKYLGRASIPLKPVDFKALSISGDITYAEINVKRNLTVFDIATNDSGFALDLDDTVVYRINSAKPAGDFIINSPFLSTSLNTASYFSPRKLIGWDTDATNNIKALAQLTENNVVSRLNQFDIPAGLVDTAIDIYSDVGNLGRKAVVLTYSDTAGVGWRLHTVNNADVITTTGLKNSTAPTFATFEPLAIQPLWDGNVSGISYTPIIITSTNKDVLVLERDGVGGAAMTIRLISLVIPDDNGNPMEWFGMFNSNRRDRFIHQEDNGIFKLVYSYNAGTSTSVLTLLKLFDTSSLNVGTVYSGSQYNLPNITPYSNLAIAAWPVLDTVLGNDCLGVDRREKLADGFGSYYWRVSEVNSSLCGYVAPVVVDTSPGAPNLNVGP